MTAAVRRGQGFCLGARLWQGFVLAVWVASLAAVTFGALHPEVRPPGQYHLDKVVHLGAFAWLAFLPALILPRWWAAAAVVTVIVGGGALEFAQDMLPTRTASVGDVVANTVGALLGWGIGALLKAWGRIGSR